MNTIRIERRDPSYTRETDGKTKKNKKERKGLSNEKMDKKESRSDVKGRR